MSASDVPIAVREFESAGPLDFQAKDIFIDRCYVQHGVTVTNGNVVLDVGANVGVAAAFFAEQGATVHSFEPVGPIFEMLQRNVATYASVTPYYFGMAARDEQTTITWYPNVDGQSSLYADPERDRLFCRTVKENASHSAAVIEDALATWYEPVTVPCELRTVSGFVERHGIRAVDLLKIDVERAELDVLIGTLDVLPRVRQLAVEVHDDNGEIREIIGLLNEFDTYVEQAALFRSTSLHTLWAVRKQTS